MSTPNQLSDTPRTDAAWAKTFQDDEDQCRAGNAATDMRDECATLERELAALAAERDQLRAELALGQQNCDDAYDDLRAERAAAIARAESAEREAFDWKKIARYETARAERAEAELSAEQDKCDKLLSVLVYADQILDDIDTCSDAHKPMYSTYSQNVFKLCIKGRDARRAAIDAAMKEGA